MKIKSITRKNLCNSVSLIDIGVQDDHTFYVSDKSDGTYVLTHNSFPDIDSDFSDREKAVELLQQFFGGENVIPVSNFAALKPLSLIKDLSKIYDVPFDEVNKYTVNMSKEVISVMKQESGFDAAQFELTFEDLEKHSPSYQQFMKNIGEHYPGFRETLLTLFKQQRTVSRHAGGVIITDNSREGMPLIKAKKGLQTPWPEGISARHLEEFGLLKFDILGLGTLRMFEECIRKILKKQGKKYVTFEDVNSFYYQTLHPDNNELDDLNVYKTVFWERKHGGIFQFVKENVQQFMAEMKPTSILDIAIATSIFRPGPLGLKADKLYLENRKDPSRINYAHPILEEVLGPTAGLLIFQEQLQLIVHKLAGWHLDDTDGVRKAFTKKDKANADKQKKEIEILGDKFIQDSIKHSGVTEEQARTVWADFEKWTAYGFNKSHATGYAITSYICAWFLTYYPDEWISTYINYCTTSKGKSASGEDPKAVALTEAKAIGYQIGSPDINHFELDFSVKEVNGRKTLVPSCLSLKGVGQAAFNEIIQYRPYEKITDLLINADGTWRHSKFNKGGLSALIKLEAFGSMDLVGHEKTFANYKQMHAALIDHYDELKRASARKKNNNVGELLEKIIAEIKVSNPEDWTASEKIGFSKELAGSVDMDLVMPPAIKRLLDAKNIKSIDYWDNEEEYYWAIVTSCENAKTKTGNYYLKMKIYGESETQVPCSVWNVKSQDSKINSFDLILSRFKRNDFGFSTFFNGIKKLKTS